MKLILFFADLFFMIYGMQQIDEKIAQLILEKTSLVKSFTEKQLQGSLAGGTKLYLQLNFQVQQNAIEQESISVYVGKYKCPIIEKYDENIIVCQTQKPDPNDQNLTELDIVVIFQYRLSTCSARFCTFSYSKQLTPQVKTISPQIAYPGSSFIWAGKFTNSQINPDQLSIFIGPYKCEIPQDYIEQGQTNVQCQIANDVEAGAYEYKIQTEYGQQLSAGLIQPNYQKEEDIEILIIPVITKLSTNYFSSQGQIMQIEAKGVKQKDYIKISFLSKDLTILEYKHISQDLSIIKVKLPQLTNQEYEEQSIYLQGSGMFITKYSYNFDDLFFYYMHNNKKYFDRYIIKEEIPEAYGQPELRNNLRQSTYLRGFFKAPCEGDYKFYIASRQQSKIYLSTKQNSIDYINLELIAQNKDSEWRNYWKYYLDNQNEINSISKPITLDEGGFYYLEIYNFGDPMNYFTASVEMPQNCFVKGNNFQQIYSLYTITTSYDPDYEILQILLYNSLSNTPLQGTYSLNFTKCKIKQIIPLYTAYDLKKQLSDYCFYTTEVTRKKIDISENVLEDQSEVNFAGFLYEIKFIRPREIQYKHQIPQFQDNNLWGGNLGFNSTIISSASDTISGYFKLQFNYTTKLNQLQSKQIQLNYDTNSYLLAIELESITDIIPNIWTQGTAKEGWKWVIQMRDDKIKSIEIVEQELLPSFEDSNRNAKVFIEQNIQSSQNLFFEPIPNSLLYTFSTVPQIQLTYKGQLGFCIKDGICDFTLADSKTPTLADFTRTENQLSITLNSGTELAELKIEFLTINFAGGDCTNIKTSSYQSPYIYTCTLESENNQLILEAGDQVPIVHYEGIGFSKISENVKPESIELKISKVDPKIVSPNGGNTITVTGSGFPKNFESSNSIKNAIYQFNEQRFTPLSISNTQIVFISPMISQYYDVTLNIQFNGKTVTYNDLSYDNAMKLTITNLEFTSKSPTFKGLLKITGTNFGTDKTKLNVQLISSDKTYDAVVAETTDTELRCYLRGGMPGEYDLFVFREGYGKSSSLNQNKFNYETVVSGVYTSIDNQNPAAGSESGGTRIKITGRNFIPNETMIFIGNQINWICELDKEASTETELFCITPPKHESYIEPQKIIISTRITLESVTKCQENTECTFEYKESLTPQIKFEDDTLIRTQVANSLQKITVTYGSGPFKILFKGSVDEEVECQLDGDNLTYTVPELPLGEYFTYLTSPSGYANQMWITKINLKIYSVTPQTVFKGGQIIIVKGEGFNKNQLAWIRVMIGDQGCEQLQIISSIELQCRTPVLISQKQLCIKQYDISNIPFKENRICYESYLKINSTGQPILSSSSCQQEQKVICTIQGSNLKGENVQISASYYNEIYQGNSVSISDNEVVIEFTNLPIGNYRIEYQTNAKFLFFDQRIKGINFQKSKGSQPISFAGGSEITFTGKGFDENIDYTKVNVCGLNCQVLRANYEELVCTAPSLLLMADSDSDSEYVDPSQFDIIADTQSKAKLIVDKQETTFYDSESSGECYFIIDFGKYKKFKLHQLNYKPVYLYAASNLVEAQFQTSTGNDEFTILFEIDNNVHSGWNRYLVRDSMDYIQKIKLTGKSKTKCRIAEIELKGWLSTNLDQSVDQILQCDAFFSINGFEFQIEEAVAYSQDVTPVVKEVSPAFGSPFQNTQLHITGTGFNQVIEQNKVIINGVDCNIESATVSEIVCTTGIQSQNQILSQSFQVEVNGNLALNYAEFKYAYRWTELDTWGGYLKPSNGDSVVVPKGMILIVDESTPQLVSILVEGTLIVEDKNEINIDAQYIIFKGGHLIIGTYDKPHQNKVSITLRGGWKDTQMPEFGNKVLGCYECILDIHGLKKEFTWTLLSETAKAKTDQLIVDDNVDWEVGDTIFISSSNNDKECETTTIKSIQDNKITIDPPLQYDHYSVIEEYDSDSFPLKVEIGLLNRNIVIQSEESLEEYGSQTIIQGTQQMGTKVRISYTEFKYGGQPIYNRYPLYFKNNGGLVDSFVIGNAFHQNFARCIVLNNVQFLKLSKNVCYDTFGHGIYLGSGKEADNIFEDNLIVLVKSTNKLEKNELKVAAFYITNPQNIIRRNRVAGSEYNGFWYDIQASNNDNCPQGLNILEFKENYSHSNQMNGLMISSLIPRKSSCSEINLQNPSTQSKLNQFKTWKNQDQGIQGDNLGQILFDDIMVADSGKKAIAIFSTNKYQIILSNLLIVGRSKTNSDPNQYKYSKGILIPSSQGILVTNIKFSMDQDQYLIQTQYSYIDAQFEKVLILKDQSQIIQWENKNQIIQDLDGSLTNSKESSFLISYKSYIAGIEGCNQLEGEQWSYSMVCIKSKVELRNIKFTQVSPLTYQIQIKRIEQNIFQTEYYYQQVIIVALGFTYEIIFGNQYQQINFDTLLFSYSQYSNSQNDLNDLNKKGVTLRFKYTNYRERFNVYKQQYYLFDEQCQKDDNTECNSCDANVCQNGQSYHNSDSKYFDLCVNNNNANEIQFKVEAKLCTTNCQNAGKDITASYNWDDKKAWENNAVPQDNEDAIINKEYNITLTHNIKLKSLTVLGNLILNANNLTLEAKQIWILNGSIIAGTPEEPFQNSIKIILGDSEDQEDRSPTILDQDLFYGDSNLLVTGRLLLYGLKPQVMQTRLIKSAKADELEIQVASSIGWKVGNQIVIGPSGSDPDQTESNIISGIENNILTLTYKLKYDHYGAENPTIQKDQIGVLDMRTVIGYLTRNIKIMGQTKRKKQNCQLLITEYDNPESFTGITDRGSVVLQGVEFSNCNQENNVWVELKNLKQVNYKINSAITDCSFHDSNSQLLSISKSENITLSNNIFFNGSQTLVSIAQSQYIIFKQNLLMYVTKGFNSYAVLGNFANTNYDMTKDIIDISENIGQASQDSGFYFMATSCSQGDKISFTKNYCSSTAKACYGIESSTNSNCWTFQGLQAYHSTVGIQVTFKATEIRASRLLLAENKKGIILKPGSSSIDNNVIQLTYSFITALARPTCEFCYNDMLTPFCQNIIAVQLGSVTDTTYSPRNQISSTQFDLINSISRLDLRVYIENVEFDQFKLKYDGIPYCEKNAVFRQNSNAHDQIGQHYLIDTQCTNCDQEAKLYGLLDADQTQTGSLGGCGTFPCTGMINALIEDQDGGFFGQIGSAIPNNQYFGPSVPYCNKQEEWNGYFCIGQQATVLNFMSTAPDYKNRLYSPVELTDGFFYNKLNSFKEWNWNGNIPLNSRESKFIGLVSVNSTIEMKTAGPAPTSSEYWLSKKQLSGSPFDWVIIKLQFTQSLMVQVKAADKIIQPGTTAQGYQYDLTTMTHICGANNYYYETRAIHFVVNGALNCKVSLSLKNTLQVSTRLVITTQEFLREKFIQYAVALLGGDPYNYFILGVKLGNRRLLAEGEGNEVIVDWAYVDSAEIGTVEGSESKSKLEAVSAKLVGFQPTEVGKVISNTPKIESIEELNYESTESSTSDNPSTSTEPVVSTEPTTPTNSTTSSTNPDPGSTNSQSTNSNNQNSQSNNSQQNSNSSYQQTKIPNNNNKEVEEDPPLIPDDSVPYVPPYYNNSTFKNNQNNAQNYQQEKDSSFSNQIRQNSKEEKKLSQNLIIVIIIIGSIVLISIMIAIYFWVKRVQAYKIVPANQQKENIPNIQQDLVIPEIEFESLSCTNKTL